MVQYNNPLHASWYNGNLNIAPGAFRGNEYFVDANTGNNNDNGLSWACAKASIASAITASNAEVGSYNMNNIYVNAQTYTEDLTTAPKNVNIIGVGAKTRLTGNQAFAATSQNYHFWNIQFRAATGTAVTIPSTSYGVGFHGCTFDGYGTATIGLSVGGCHDLMVEDCRFLGNPIYTTAIQITGNNLRSVIKNNLIAATTNGILVDDALSGYGNFMIGNIICRRTADPNSSNQMTYGIRMARDDALNGWLIVNNRIAAGDGISIAHAAGTQAQDACIANRTGQGGIAAWEDA